eukprot:1344115-Amorphochlora_amoeboformis.AAC.1
MSTTPPFFVGIYDTWDINGGDRWSSEVSWRFPGAILEIDSPRAPHISRHRRDPQNPTSSAPDQPGDCKTPVGQVQHQQMPDQLNHILPVLRSMLLRFTVTEEMYLELAGIIGRDYKTNEDRVQAVQRTISTWKQDGLLRLRIPYRRQRRAAPTATHMAPQNGRRR